MEKFNKNIEGIRKMLADKKGEKYAISNQDIMVLDEYIKNLYLKVLCTLVQYENNPTDMQILFLKYIVNGMGVDAPVEEYMRKALEISETDMQEFLSIMAENKVKYYFVLEGILLVSLGNPERENYVYSSEIIELINVNKDDLEYVSLVAKSVLWQQSSFYDEAKNRINERVQSIDFTSYIKNYYAGAIVDTDTEKHYSAPDKKLSESMVYPTVFKERKVVFENVVLNIGERWVFEGCEEVIFRNCLILGKEFPFSFKSIGTLVIEKCKINDFTNRFGHTESVDNLTINNSEFIACGYTGSGGIIGGGIFSANGSAFNEINIKNSQFLNCYVADTHRDNWVSNGILFLFAEKSILMKSFNLTGNRFIGCMCKNKGDTSIVGPVFMFTKCIDQDNVCTGGVTRIFDESRF